MSPPSRGRGSKRDTTPPHADHRGRPPRGGVDRNDALILRTVPSAVAPLAGAWIETYPTDGPSWLPRSPPSRGRGSKHAARALCSWSDQSPPSRGRGSKQRLSNLT